MPEEVSRSLEAGEPGPEGEPEVAALEDEEPPPVVRKHAVDLTQGSLLQGIVMLSWPIVAGSLLNWLMGVADIKMVGSLGPEAIAAVGQSQGIIMLVMALVFALGTGTQVLVARYAGAHQPEKVGAVTRQTIILCVLCGAVMVPLGQGLSGPMLVRLGVNGATLAQAVVYTNITFWASIGLMMNLLMTSALQGAGDTRTPLKLLVWMNLLHVGVEYVLIFGVGPFPRLGVAGAAWAVVVSRYLIAILMLWVITSGRYAVAVPWRGPWRVDLRIWRRILTIGIPSSLQGMTRGLSFLMLVYVLNHTVAGFLAVSGHTAASQWGQLGIFVGLAMMTAAMTAVGQNMGAHRVDRAERSCWQVARISLTVSSAIAALCIVFAYPLVGFFTDDPQARHYAAVALIYLSVSLPFATLSMAFSGALRGAGDTMSPMWATIACSLGIGPALAYLLALTLHLGPGGAWAGLAVSMVAQAAVTGAIFRRGKWKGIEV